MRQALLLGLALLLLPALSLAADADADGVLDERDACPDTPDGATTIDPSDNLDYAGCSCDQVEERVDTDNPCVSFYCHGTVLEIRDAPFDGPVTDCPEDRCVGYNHYDYPPDGFSNCQDGRVVEYSCDPEVVVDSPVCGYVENRTVNASSDNESDGKPLPTLVGTTRTFHLTDATLTYAHPSNISQDEKVIFQVLFILEGGERKELDVDMVQDGETLEKREAYCGEDEDILFCTASWRLRTARPGKHSANLTFTYNPGSGVISEDLPVGFTVTERPFAPKAAETPVVGKGLDGLTPREEVLLKSIHRELFEDGLTSLDQDSFIGLAEETHRHVAVTKDLEYDEESDRTVFTVTLEPRPGVKVANLTVVEYLPKALAASAGDVVFSHEPVVVRDDPLIMWHFTAVDDRVDLSYETPGEAEVTGNTVAVAEGVEDRQSVWLIVLPMLLIPFVALLLIGLPKLLHHRKR
ncbi:hypothetical protein KY327_01570 [Candidatus Woesearchaeota archaeon]|nr:hypothetical protein [Candidatus Woesearchaeota archaeon]